MPENLLIIGSGSALGRAVTAARQLGLAFVAASPAKTDEIQPEIGAVINYHSTATLIQFATDEGVDKAYACSLDVLMDLAEVNQALDLPGVTTTTAERLVNRGEMHDRLDRVGLPVPRYRIVANAEDAVAAVKAIGRPVVFKPLDGHRGRGVRIVEYVEDVPLYFKKASSASTSEKVIVEEYLNGEVYVVEGELVGGVFPHPCVARKILDSWPHSTELGYLLPPDDGVVIERLVEFTASAARAFDLAESAVSAEVVFTKEGPRLLSMSNCLCASHTAAHVIPIHAHLDPILENLRRSCAIGTLTRPSNKQHAALLWLNCSTGVVEGLTGLEEARKLEGVAAACSLLQTGDLIGHTHDVAMRERIGFWLAHGGSAKEALERAVRARECCHVVTRPTL